MPHHNRSPQQSEPTSSSPSFSPEPVPPSFDPALASPITGPPTQPTQGDPDSGKAAGTAPSSSTAPANPTANPTADPTANPTTTAPATTSDPATSTRPPADQPPTALPAPAPAHTQPSEPSKHPAAAQHSDPNPPAQAPPDTTPAISTSTSTNTNTNANTNANTNTNTNTNPNTNTNTNTNTGSTAPATPKQASSAQSTPPAPASQPLPGTSTQNTIDQPKAADQAPVRAAQHQQKPHADDATHAPIGTIIGVLVAAVVGAIIIAAVVSMVKRKKRSRDHQAEFHQNIFHEKNSFERDMDRKSLGAASLGIPITPDANRSFNQRTDPIFRPRPPSIIERHQASPAVPGPIMPSYQPGQVLNYPPYPGQQPVQHSFNLHRPKPPTYHSGSIADSGLAYSTTTSPLLDYPATPQSLQHDQNNMSRAMSNQDPSQPQSYDYNQYGGNNNNNIPMQNMLPYSPGGDSQAGYAINQTLSVPAPTNYQQQVDQLDFFGQPSPALTMVGPMTTDWSVREASPKPSDAGAAAAAVAPGSPQPASPDPIEDRSGTPMIPNVQQSYLDCHNRGSEQMDTDGNQLPVQDWKIASPNLASPLGELFKDDAFTHEPDSYTDRPPSDTMVERPALKVINP